jgi:diaminopimelate epimerase
MKIHFYKYQGTGNDFVIIDDRQKTFPVQNQPLIEKLCDRRFGIGADGLILLQNNPDFDFEMVYFNSDGRPSTMCGNGGRCIAAFAKFLGVIDENNEGSFIAADGPHKVTFEGDKVSLQMKDVDATSMRNDKDYVLNTGSPHYVVFTDDADKIDIVNEAHKIRYNDEFKKEGINVNFVETIGDGQIKVRTYERGVEDETFSCGTGVVASSIASFLYAQKESISKNSQNQAFHTKVQTKGGNLEVSFKVSEKVEGGFEDVWLIGPAIQVFEGEVEIDSK